MTSTGITDMRNEWRKMRSGCSIYVDGWGIFQRQVLHLYQKDKQAWQTSSRQLLPRHIPGSSCWCQENSWLLDANPWSANSCWRPCLRWTLCGSVRNVVGAPWPGDLRLACLEDSSPHHPLFTRKTQTALGWFVDHSTKLARGWKTETAHGLCLSDLKHLFTSLEAKDWPHDFWNFQVFKQLV